jgi:hypothetical protein
MAFQHVAGRNLVSDYADGSTICGSNEFSKAFLPLICYGLYDITGETYFYTLPL